MGWGRMGWGSVALDQGQKYQIVRKIRYVVLYYNC